MLPSLALPTAAPSRRDRAARAARAAPYPREPAAPAPDAEFEAAFRKYLRGWGFGVRRAAGGLERHSSPELGDLVRRAASSAAASGARGGFNAFAPVEGLDREVQLLSGLPPGPLGLRRPLPPEPVGGGRAAMFMLAMGSPSPPSQRDEFREMWLTIKASVAGVAPAVYAAALMDDQPKARLAILMHRAQTDLDAYLKGGGGLSFAEPPSRSREFEIVALKSALEDLVRRASRERLLLLDLRPANIVMDEVGAEARLFAIDFDPRLSARLDRVEAGCVLFLNCFVLTNWLFCAQTAFSKQFAAAMTAGLREEMQRYAGSDSLCRAFKSVKFEDIRMGYSGDSLAEMPDDERVRLMLTFALRRCRVEETLLRPRWTEMRDRGKIDESSLFAEKLLQMWEQAGERPFEWKKWFGLF